MKSSKSIYIAIALLSTVSFGCSDDEDAGSYPPVRTELVEALTGGDKNVTEVRLDDGTVYPVSQSISTNTADTAYRCVCSYTYDEEKRKLSVYTLSGIPSSRPIVTDSLPPEQSGEYKLISSWITERYINAYLSYQTTSQGTHRFYFVEDSISKTSDGKQVAHVRLYHENPPDDPGSYSQKQYISLPSYFYHGKVDTVRLEIGGKTITALP